MNAAQARALFLDQCRPGDRGNLERHGEKAAVTAILAAVDAAEAELASLRQSEHSWKTNYRATMDVNAQLRAEVASLRAYVSQCEQDADDGAFWACSEAQS